MPTDPYLNFHPTPTKPKPGQPIEIDTFSEETSDPTVESAAHVEDLDETTKPPKD
jgi:hypothetical protein